MDCPKVILSSGVYCTYYLYEIGLNKRPVICGGFLNNQYSKRCYSLESNTWVASTDTSHFRGYAASTQLKDGAFLVTGGIYEPVGYINSTEMLTNRLWQALPSLPVLTKYHCMVTVNKTTVMAISGYPHTSQTFYFTFGEKRWTEGPKLKIWGRYCKIPVCNV